MAGYTENVEAYSVSEYEGFEVVGMFEHAEEVNKHNINLMAYTTWAIAYQWEVEEMPNLEKVRGVLQVATFYVSDPDENERLRSDELGEFSGVNVESQSLDVYGKDTPMVYVSSKIWNVAHSFTNIKVLSHEFLHTAVYKAFPDARGAFRHEEPFGRDVNPIWFEYWEKAEDRTHEFGPYLFEYRAYCRAIWALERDGYEFHPSETSCDNNYNRMGMSDPTPEPPELEIAPVNIPGANLELPPIK